MPQMNELPRWPLAIVFWTAGMAAVLFVLITACIGCAAIGGGGTDVAAVDSSHALACVAADVAMLSPRPVVPPAPPTPDQDCERCGNSGCVRSGDGLSWVACDQCTRACTKAAASTSEPQTEIEPVASDDELVASADAVEPSGSTDPPAKHPWPAYLGAPAVGYEWRKIRTCSGGVCREQWRQVRVAPLQASGVRRSSRAASSRRWRLLDRIRTRRR